MSDIYCVTWDDFPFQCLSSQSKAIFTFLSDNIYAINIYIDGGSKSLDNKKKQKGYNCYLASRVEIWEHTWKCKAEKCDWLCILSGPQSPKSAASAT